MYEFSKLTKFQNHFKVTISYEDTTNHKPHPDPLLLAAKKLGLKPEECVYIGDVENDLVAAKACGMKFIAYSQEKINWAELQISSFKQLEKTIVNLC